SCEGWLAARSLWSACSWFSPAPPEPGPGASDFSADAVSPFGDLDQDPVGDGEVVRVEAGEDALGDGADGAREFGAECGAFGGELRRARAVWRAAGDESLGFQAAEELGNLQPVEADLRLASEI